MRASRMDDARRPPASAAWPARRLWVTREATGTLTELWKHRSIRHADGSSDPDGGPDGDLWGPSEPRDPCGDRVDACGRAMPLLRFRPAPGRDRSSWSSRPSRPSVALGALFCTRRAAPFTARTRACAVHMLARRPVARPRRREHARLGLWSRRLRRSLRRGLVGHRLCRHLLLFGPLGHRSAREGRAPHGRKRAYRHFPQPSSWPPSGPPPYRRVRAAVSRRQSRYYGPAPEQSDAGLFFYL